MSDIVRILSAVIILMTASINLNAQNQSDIDALQDRIEFYKKAQIESASRLDKLNELTNKTTKELDVLPKKVSSNIEITLTKKLMKRPVGTKMYVWERLNTTYTFAFDKDATSSYSIDRPTLEKKSDVVVKYNEYLKLKQAYDITDKNRRRYERNLNSWAKETKLVNSSILEYNKLLREANTGLITATKAFKTHNAEREADSAKRESDNAELEASYLGIATNSKRSIERSEYIAIYNAIKDTPHDGFLTEREIELIESKKMLDVLNREYIILDYTDIPKIFHYKYAAYSDVEGNSYLSFPIQEKINQNDWDAYVYSGIKIDNSNKVDYVFFSVDTWGFNQSLSMKREEARAVAKVTVLFKIEKILFKKKFIYSYENGVPINEGVVHLNEDDKCYSVDISFSKSVHIIRYKDGTTKILH